MAISKEAMAYIKQRWEEFAAGIREGKIRGGIPSFDEEIEMIAGFYDDYLKLPTNKSDVPNGG